MSSRSSTKASCSIPLIVGRWLALLVFAVPMQAQTPLPDAMKARFEINDTVAAILRPAPLSTEDPTARVKFETVGKSVSLEWTFGIPGTENGFGTLDNGWRWDEISLGYEPTALCAAAGSSTRFFIAGWVERLSAIMIEQIDVTNMAVATVPTPSGGEPIATLVLSYERSVLLLRSDIGPVRALSYHHTLGELWLLEEALNPRLMSFDVETGLTMEISNSTAMPELAQMHSALEVFVDPASATEGGFYVILRPQFAWDSIDDVDPQSKACVFRDEDLDGVLDESAALTWAQVTSQVAFDSADWWYD